MHTKVMGTLLFINRIKGKFDNDTRTVVVQSFALSVMNYCLAFYGTTNNALLHRVQKLQNFAAKICVRGAKISDNATPFITQLHWLKVKEIGFLCGYQCLQDLKVFPEWHVQLPMISEVTYNKHTRQHDKLYMLHTNTAGNVLSLCWDPGCGTNYPPMSHTLTPYLCL